MGEMILHLTKIQEKIRGWLGRHRILYAFVAGVGVVLFWRGVWHMTDFFAATFLSWKGGVTSIDYFQGIDSLFSLIVGGILLLTTGLFVAELLSGEVVLSTLKTEKKVTEKTEGEVKQEESELSVIHNELHKIAEKMEEIDKEIHHQEIHERQ